MESKKILFTGRSGFRQHTLRYYVEQLQYDGYTCTAERADNKAIPDDYALIVYQLSSLPLRNGDVEYLRSLKPCSAKVIGASNFSQADSDFKEVVSETEGLVDKIVSLTDTSPVKFPRIVDEVLRIRA